MSANSFGSMLRTIARKLLPTGLRKILRQFYEYLTPLSISFELISEWPDADDGCSWAAPSIAARYKRSVGTYLNTAKESPETAFQSRIVRDNIEALKKIGLSKATLLDFGCGDGRYRTILAAIPATADWEYVGADINAALVEFCRTMHPDTRFELVEKGSVLPFRDGEFDIVLASGTVQYIQDHVAILSELHRITRGYIVVSRLPLWRYNSSQIVLQHVRDEWGEEHYPLHVPGVSETMVHNLYLMKKIGVAQ